LQNMPFGIYTNLNSAVKFIIGSALREWQSIAVRAHDGLAAYPPCPYLGGREGQTQGVYMKSKRVLFGMVLVLTFGSLCSMGCATKPVPYSYSFAKDDSNAAAIHFQCDVEEKVGTTGVDFVNFDGTKPKLPKPERRTRWASVNSDITFPASEPLELKVHAYHQTAIMPMGNAGIFCIEIGEKIMEFGSMLTATGIGAIIGIPIFVIGAVPMGLGFGFFGLALVIDWPIALSLNFNKKIMFECPALEAGKSYTLKVRRKSKSSGENPGAKRALVLTYADSDTVVYEQEF
jgi:hypothetical protein